MYIYCVDGCPVYEVFVILKMISVYIYFPAMRLATLYLVPLSTPMTQSVGWEVPPGVRGLWWQPVAPYSASGPTSEEASVFQPI